MNEVFQTKGSYSVVNQRIESEQALDTYWTPPWATRALCEEVLPAMGTSLRGKTVWDPCCGMHHMSDVLAEYVGNGSVYATDIADHNMDHPVYDYLTAPYNFGFNWIVMNPPFKLGLEFVQKALLEASQGVAALLRTNWVEGGERYHTLFKVLPPTRIAFFSERVPMHRGRWEPNGSTATSYSWFVWTKSPIGLFRSEWDEPDAPLWIAPHCRKLYTRPDDEERFAGRVLASQT
jgi:hypothetical protein